VGSERWRQVTEIFHAALASDPARRAAFLAAACGDDAVLRAEVEVLVAAYHEAGPFGETPVFVPALSLEAGSSIGSYRIEELLGAGGMGEVYRARDATLERDVAIKVLPQPFTSDSERVARLLREARLLAALSHPNIAAIYGVVEADAHRGLVLEYVEGPTLADRLRSDGIPLPEALSIARQIADALDAAHGKGIIHRDLKPANIKAAPGGIVKVLDFGLAKIGADNGGPSADVSQSPRVTVGSTRAGVILGTAAYMSPEQARGKPVDKRTDIWSFGCVLYEMLTGRMVFCEETVSDTIASILTREPDWAAVPETTPLGVRRMLQRCLERDPQQRLRDIGDVKHELDHAVVDLRAPTVASRAVATPAHRPPAAQRWSFAAAGLALIVLVSVGAAFLFVRQTTPPPPAAEPPLQLTDFNDSAIHPAVSPDGRMVTFIRGGSFATSAGGRTDVQIYVKILPTGEPVQLTRDPYQKEQPVFSPDGSRIIYAAVLPGFRWDSWQVPVLGGAPQPFLPNASGLVWLDDQRLLYSELMGGGIHMGVVTSTESRTDSRPIYFPRLEGGMAHRSAPSPDRKQVLVVEMSGGEWQPCRLVPFDGSSTGRPIGPLDGQCTTATWSNDGRWMYFSSNAGGAFHVWRQRYPDGTPEQITFGPTEQEGTALTPDGRYLITSMGFQQASISLKDPSGDRQLTSEGFAMLPTMLPSGDRMFYLMRTGSRGYASGELWSLNPGTGEKARALPGRVMADYSISADGRRVVFTSAGSASDDGIWVADLDRRTPPRQLTRGGEFRAFFGGPGEIVYISPQAERRYLYRMREDGSGVEQIRPEAVDNLITVSPDGQWAVVFLPGTTGGRLALQIMPLHGGAPMTACESCVEFGIGPNRIRGNPINWSMDGKSVYVSLQYFGLGTEKTVVLPYRAGVPLAALWRRGLRSEHDVAANPGATVINEANVFPAASASAHLSWRRTTQSNLYRVRLPD
jgi:serine/threonine protein kinase/Tol biopolymer transport system component